MGEAETPAGGSAAATAAGKSAVRAEDAAVSAADSANQAAEAAARAIVAAELVPILAALAELRDASAATKSETDKLAAEEIADDAQVSQMQSALIAFQSQNLWLSSGLVLFGAAAGYILERAFG